MWTCPKCGSKVLTGYLTCWSCGTLQEGAAGPTAGRAEESGSAGWTCPKCGEAVDPGFEVCWSCGTSKEGDEDPTFVREDEAEVTSATTSDEPLPDEFLPPVVPERLLCLRCFGEMREGFVAGSRDGITDSPIRWYPGRPESALRSGTTSDVDAPIVRTFRCLSCGYLESYANVVPGKETPR